MKKDDNVKGTEKPAKQKKPTIWMMKPLVSTIAPLKRNKPLKLVPNKVKE